MLRVARRTRLLLRRDVTLGEVFDRLADVHEHDVAVRQSGPDLALSFRQAAELVAARAGVIAGRIRLGDRVVLATENSYEQLLLSCAAARAGGVPVPVNPLLPKGEIDHVVSDSGATLVVRSAAELDEPGVPLPPADDVDPRSVAALFYTSGTTGRPKGVALRHDALVGQTLRGGVLWPAELRQLVAVISLPVAHIMGFAALLGLASAGATVRFLPHFRPDDVLDAIEGERAAMFIGVPAMYRMLLSAGAEERDLSSVRIWASGADVMPEDLAARFKRMGAMAKVPGIGPVGDATFVEGYGMVEASGGVAAKVSPPFTARGLGQSLGFRLPGYRFRVIDDDGRTVRPGEVGELHVKGPGILDGYWNAPEATRDALTLDGWLRTGDLVRRGPMGSVLFAGRKKDVIMPGGYTVYAVEIEKALEEHPGVLEAAAVAMPDEKLGEVPVAVVVVSDKKLKPKALQVWAENRLAEYKVPKRIEIVDELPRTSTRKVRKDELRQQLGS